MKFITLLPLALMLSILPVDIPNGDIGAAIAAHIAR